MARQKLGLSRRDFLKAAALGSAGVALAQYLPALAQSGSINYWHHFTSDSEFEALEDVLALFAERYPDIAVTQENIPNDDFMARFTAAVAADTRPDTVMVATERFADMVGMGGLVDLTDRINNWELIEYFPENRWGGVTQDGKIYGVPAFTFIDWAYYRVDFFEEAGIAGPPITFDEFLDAAIRLTDESQGRYGFGMRGGGGGQDFITNIIEAFGSPVVVDGQPAIDRDIAIDAIRWYSELYTVHHVAPPSAPGDSYRQIMEAFKTGQTAMVWHHTGSLAEIHGALGDKFMSAVRPAGSDDNHSLTRVSYLYNGIMKEDNLDAAWAWISFWGENDPAIALLEKTGYFPASAAVGDDPRIAENRLYDAALAALEIGLEPTSFVGYPDWSANIALPAFQRILVGEATVEEAVDEMIAGLEQTLE
jgi:multiple sugar transport system substrate-binding protein